MARSLLVRTNITVVAALTITSALSMSLHQHLRNGGRCYGPLLLGDSPLAAELLALVGYDFLIVDHEHSPTNVHAGYRMLQAVDAAQSNTQQIVRVPSATDPVYMKKVLDSMRLPGGVLVPMVETADMAAAVVQSTRYPVGIGRTISKDDENDSRNSLILNGKRGCAAPLVRASGWGLSRQDYLQQAADDLLVMVPVETADAIAAVPDIAAVPGIDGIFIGPLDLSASVGKMGQFHDPEVQALMASAERAIRDADGVFLAGFRAPERELRDMYAAGYQLVCGSVDLGLLREAAKADLASAQEFL
jgi:2-keto-3-deoxy-L-rhamnonate aldolase RhmA